VKGSAEQVVPTSQGHQRDRVSAAPQPFARWWSTVAALGVAVTQALDLPSALRENLPTGLIQLIQAVVFVVLAVLWQRPTARWPWVVAGVFSLAAVTGIVVGHTVGSPGHAADIGQWTDPLLLFTLGFYLLVLTLVTVRLLARRAT
jgi:hypothetical protein